MQRVLTENDRVIHLYDTVSDFGTYYATLLDKQNKKFSMVTVIPGGESHKISGPCEIY